MIVAAAVSSEDRSKMSEEREQMEAERQKIIMERKTAEADRGNFVDERIEWMAKIEQLQAELGQQTKVLGDQ